MAQYTINRPKFAKPNSAQFIEHMQFRNRQKKLSENLPDTLALISAFAVQPSANRHKSINNFITKGIVDGWWVKLSAFYMFVAKDEQSSLLNWKNPSGLAAVGVSSPTFVENSGWYSDGIASYLNTQISPTTTPLFTQNNAHAGGMMKHQAGVNCHIVGASTSSASLRISRNLSNTMSLALNGAAAQTATTHADAKHLLLNRIDASGFSRFENGIDIGSVSVASVALVNTPVHALRISTAFSTAGAIVRSLHWGSALSNFEANSLALAQIDYLSNVGAAS